MLQDSVLAWLKSADSPHSGEEMSSRLGVSRAAVWKAMEALREQGYVIASSPRLGYRLEYAPDLLSPGELSGLSGVIGREVLCLSTVDSTNNELRRLAADGAAEGLVVLADQQTGGRGRMGRTFLSPKGAGLYCSLLLRPQLPPEAVTNLTAWVAVALCDGIEAVCGVRPGIKWTNDLILDGKKLCGILTELGLEGESGALSYVICGMGVNLHQTQADFGPEVGQLAISLEQALGTAPRRADLALALLHALERMYQGFPGEKPRYLAQYRADCLTTGRQVRLVRGETSRTAFAVEIDDDFGLVVRHPDGRLETIRAGEVSVRGLLGYL